MNLFYFCNDMTQNVSDIFNRIMSVWNEILKLGLRLPFSNVDKSAYLHKMLSPYLTEEKIAIAIQEKPSKVLDPAIIDSIAKREIWKQTMLVSFVSCIAALPPDGWLMWVAIGLDFLQFQIQVFIILQKLLYLYGYKKMSDDSGSLTTSPDMLLLLMTTIMIGKHQATRMFKSAVGAVFKQAIQRFATRIMTRLLILNVLRQTAKWFGITLTKEMIINGMNMIIIPLSCALVSGFISYWLFSPMAKNLQRHLISLNGADEEQIENLYKKEEESNLDS